MKYAGMKISTRITAGLAVIISFVLLLGAASAWQAGLMWSETAGLYNHPLQVGRAVGQLEVDVLKIFQDTYLYAAANDESARRGIRARIEQSESDAESRLKVLYDRYLGKRESVDAVQAGIVEYRSIRIDVTEKVDNGDSAGAASLAAPEGPMASVRDRVMKDLSVISSFAINRGDRFFVDAREARDRMALMMGGLLFVILSLSIVIAWLTVRGVRKPLDELRQAADAFAGGDYSSRCSYVFPNEIGVLASSFNRLADRLETEIDVAARASAVSDEMVRSDDMGSFWKGVLKAMIAGTGADAAAVYVNDAGRQTFDLLESVGFSSSVRKSFSSADREGEIGISSMTGDVRVLSGIPAGSMLNVAMAAADIVPSEIVTIPLTDKDKTVAVLSLAGIRPFGEREIRLCRAVRDSMSARFAGVSAFEQVRAISKRLEEQNLELESQAVEIRSQADEVMAQNAELERQKWQLNEANRLKDSFLSNMSHELRTPLNSVIALSGVLSRRLKGAIPEEEHGYLEVIERNGRSLLALLNDILDLSRIESGRDDVVIESVSVHDMVSEINDMIRPTVGTRDVTLVNEVPPELPELVTDASKLRHIVQNLVANAVKFTMVGSVVVSARIEKECMKITVSDTGIGIPADRLDIIFDEFRQAEESTSRRFGGTGLGLSIARKYVKLLGGTISVESVEGRGSVFTVSIPVSPEMAPCAAHRTDDAGTRTIDLSVARSSGDGRLVLIVEDSEPAVVLLTDMLEPAGYRVAAVSNGREALDFIEHTIPDAIILDLMMPEVDGFEVLRVVRSFEKTAQVPVLILTAKHVTPEELSFLKTNHIHQLVRKGDIRRSELLAAVDSMIGTDRTRNAGKTESGGPDQPVRAVPSSAARGSSQATTGSSRVGVTGKPVILVVEDNPDNMKTIKALIGDIATVIEATDGEAGVAHAQVKMPDLILMDISLPFMDGMKALEEIRREKFLQHIPVVAVTARAMKGDREELLSMGFDGYVSKPVDGAILESTIRKLLAGKD